MNPTGTGSMVAGERGTSESLQWAVLWPLVMLLILGTVQVGVWWHARNSLDEAAAAAVDAVSLEGVDAGRAVEVAGQVAAAGGVEDITVDVSVGADGVTVVVRGRAPLVFDLGPVTLEATARAPREAW